MDEIGREDTVGLRGQELLPGRARAAGCGTDPGIMQDLPHRGGCDPVTEPDELALRTPMPPRRIVRRDANHELSDCGCRGRASGTPPKGVIPFAHGRPPVVRAASPTSPRTPRTTGPGGSAGTAPQATAGPSAGSGPGLPGGAAPRSRAAELGARHPWTPRAGPAPSGSRAAGARAGRRLRRSLGDDLSAEDGPDRVIEPHRFQPPTNFRRAWQGGILDQAAHSPVLGPVARRPGRTSPK